MFTPRNRKYKNGYRPNRSVGGVGYWKSDTKEVDIEVNTVKIGRVNSLTFHLGRQPKGTKTPWKLKEYNIKEYQLDPDPPSMLVTNTYITYYYSFILLLGGTTSHLTWGSLRLNLVLRARSIFSVE
jgi:hypothetical protein